MPADHALVAALLCFVGHRVFKVGDKVQGLFDFAFQKGGQGPIRQTHACAHAVEMAVQAQGQLVQVVTQICQPLGVLHHGVKVVAVDKPELATVFEGVHRLLRDLDATKVVLDKAPCKLVVVAGNVDHVAALAGPAQQLLHHVVVGLRPVPLAAQLPAVNDVSHQVQIVAGVGLEELNQGLGLAAGRAQVQVRNKHGAVMHPIPNAAKLWGTVTNCASLRRTVLENMGLV